MGRQTIFLTATAGLLGSGCASTPAAVRLTAEPSDLSALAGEWTGEYSSRETGRSGSIIFTITAGRDTAYGEVLMLPRGYGEPLPPGHPRVTPAQAGGQVLTIRFVRIEGGSVSGTLDPYRDPECGCMLATTFTGRLTSPNRIEGTFAIRGAGTHTWHTPATGSWHVTRDGP